MNRAPLLTLGLLAALFSSYCGAGTPQNETVRDATVLSLWPMTTSSDEARELLADGMRESDMARNREASEYFERAVLADPNSAIAHLYASASAQSLESGVAHLKKAEELSAGATQIEQVLIQRARSGFNNDPVRALELAQQLTRLAPDNPRAWDELANAQDAMQQRAEARASWAKAVEIAPSFVMPYMAASLNYAQAEPRDPVRAEEYARKAVALAPEEAFPHDLLGDALRAQGKLEEAAAEYTRTAELDPTRGDGLQQRAHVNTFLGRYAEARADYDAAVARSSGNSKSGLGMYRGLIPVYEGNPKAAVDELEKLNASIDGMNLPEPIGSKIFVLYPAFHIAVLNRMVPDAERLAAAITRLQDQQAATINTDQARRGNRGAKALREGLIAWAKRDYATAKKKAAEFMEIRGPESTSFKDRPAHDLLGMIAMDEKRYDDAVREYEQGSPGNIYFNFQHGLALERAGRQAEAQKKFEQVANYYFNFEGTALVRNAALKKIGKAVPES